MFTESQNINWKVFPKSGISKISFNYTTSKREVAKFTLWIHSVYRSLRIGGFDYKQKADGTNQPVVVLRTMFLRCKRSSFFSPSSLSFINGGNKHNQTEWSHAVSLNLFVANWPELHWVTHMSCSYEWHRGAHWRSLRSKQSSVPGNTIRGRVSNWYYQWLDVQLTVRFSLFEFSILHRKAYMVELMRRDTKKASSEIFSEWVYRVRPISNRNCTLQAFH